MFALMIIIPLLTYLYFVCRWSKSGYRSALDRWKNPLLARLLSGLILLGGFGVVFWDAIPTWYTHYKLCETEGGLKVHKTPQQWMIENPERYRKVLENAGYHADARHINNGVYKTTIIYPAYGFRSEYTRSIERSYAFHNGIQINRLYDDISGQLMLENIDFHGGSGNASLANGANDLSAYKFWTQTGFCEAAYPEMEDKYHYHGLSFDGIYSAIAKWNKK